MSNSFLLRQGGDCHHTPLGGSFAGGSFFSLGHFHNLSVPATDSRKGYHFSSLRLCLGCPGSPLPSPSSRTSLSKAAAALGRENLLQGPATFVRGLYTYTRTEAQEEKGTLHILSHSHRYNKDDGLVRVFCGARNTMCNTKAPL